MNVAAHNNPFSWSRAASIGRTFEDMLSVIVLAGLMFVPVIELSLRMFFKSGIPGATSLVQHSTLIVGMLGGAIAARESRLLSFSTLTTVLKGKLQKFSQLFSGGSGAAICVFLSVASVQFLMAEREGGKTIAFGIPVWVILLILPIGFGLIALRLGLSATTGWKQRVLLLAVVAAVVGVTRLESLSYEVLAFSGALSLLVAAFLGAPIFTVIAGATLLLLWMVQFPIASIPLKHYSLVTNPSLPAIPLFTLAGFFLAEGGASKRLISVFQLLVGRVRGGPVIVTTLVCAFFTSFTGASGVTILALGGLLFPVLRAARYSEKTALGLVTTCGSLGLLFPPCLPLILYSVIASTVATNLGGADAASAGVSMEQMFLGGIGPGILLVVLISWVGIRGGPKQKVDVEPFNAGEVRRVLWAAKWELLLPAVALGSIFSGFATTIEAAALTAVYAFVIETFVYRDLHLVRDVPRVLVECGLLVGGVLLILGVAVGLTHYLVMEQVPDRLVEWMTNSIESKWTFLLVLNLFLLVVGCLMDVYSAIVVVAPLIVPLGIAFGIDPVHLGIIFLANLELGYLTPPVGMNLFLSSYRFEKPIFTIYRAVLPMLFAMWVGVLIIPYFPPFPTFLPVLLK